MKREYNMESAKIGSGLTRFTSDTEKIIYCKKSENENCRHIKDTNQFKKKG